MDIKVDGLSFEILTKALNQAKAGRLHILDIMSQTIAEPRPELKPHAPRIEMLTIPKELIGALIGPGGKVIQEIQNTTGCTIVIEEVDNVYKEFLGDVKVKQLSIFLSPLNVHVNCYPVNGTLKFFKPCKSTFFSYFYSSDLVTK